MKNIFLIIAVTLFVFGSQSCKKPPLPIVDDTTTDTTGTGGSEVKVSPYVGTWNYTNIDLKNGILNVMGNDVGTFTGKGSEIVGKVVITERKGIISCLKGIVTLKPSKFSSFTKSLIPDKFSIS